MVLVLFRRIQSIWPTSQIVQHSLLIIVESVDEWKFELWTPKKFHPIHDFYIWHPYYWTKIIWEPPIDRFYNNNWYIWRILITNSCAIVVSERPHSCCSGDLTIYFFSLYRRGQRLSMPSILVHAWNISVRPAPINNRFYHFWRCFIIR